MNNYYNRLEQILRNIKRTFGGEDPRDILIAHDILNERIDPKVATAALMMIHGMIPEVAHEV